MTTTDLSDRLPDLLAELARATPIATDETPFDPNVARLVDDSSDAHRPRRFVAAAAAVLLIAGAGALAFTRAGAPDTAPATPPPDTAATRSTEPVPAATRPTEPTLFPVINDPPRGLEATARIDSFPASPLWTEAVVGRLEGALISDSIAITVQAEPFDIGPMAGKPPTTTEVFAQTAQIYDYGTRAGIPTVHVAWGTGPFYLASGADPVAFLDTAQPGTFTAVIEGHEAPLLTIGELPDGYEIIAEPDAVGHATTSATLSIGADNYDISVSTRNPTVYMSQGGPLRPVEVNGHPGWAFDTSVATLSQDVAWKVDDTTYAYLKVNDATNADDALALANAITFVDLDNWKDRYLANHSGT